MVEPSLALEDAAVTPEEIEMLLRREWWINHGHLGIYGDDGEMQCGECRVDYKRDPLERVQAACHSARLDRAARAIAGFHS